MPFVDLRFSEPGHPRKLLHEAPRPVLVLCVFVFEDFYLVFVLFDAHLGVSAVLVLTLRSFQDVVNLFVQVAKHLRSASQSSQGVLSLLDDHLSFVDVGSRLRNEYGSLTELLLLVVVLLDLLLMDDSLVLEAVLELQLAQGNALLLVLRYQLLKGVRNFLIISGHRWSNAWVVHHISHINYSLVWVVRSVLLGVVCALGLCIVVGVFDDAVAVASGLV